VKITLAGSGVSTIWMPIAFSCCATICSRVARAGFPEAYVYRNVAGKPEHVKYRSLASLGLVGPPVQCRWRIASAAFGLYVQRAKCGR
jgi:hypothetical protein